MIELTRFVADARARGDSRAMVDLIPYARLLGMDFSECEPGKLCYRLAYREQNIGNHLLPALHGGVIAAFMEHAALLELLWNQETSVLPKVIDFSIDYLRPGRPETTFAECTVVRQGQRVANVAVSAWQSSRERVIATARCHYLLSRPE